jgi:hypothetical protein
MPKALKPEDSGYWDRPVEELVKSLPGERLLTKDRIIVISRVEGFRDLIKDSMVEDYQLLENPSPGDVYITRQRIGTLLNVVARTSGKQPEVIWLAEMLEQGERVTGNNVVRSIMESGSKKKSAKAPSHTDILAYARQHIAGKNVQDSQSPLRIISNAELPLSDREISFNALGGTANNSIGVASLIDEVNGIETIEQARLILQQEAERLGVTGEQLLDPKNISRYAKKSPLLRKVLRFFE